MKANRTAGRKMLHSGNACSHLQSSYAQVDIPVGFLLSQPEKGVAPFPCTKAGKATHRCGFSRSIPWVSSPTSRGKEVVRVRTLPPTIMEADAAFIVLSFGGPSTPLPWFYLLASCNEAGCPLAPPPPQKKTKPNTNYRCGKPTLLPL